MQDVKTVLDVVCNMEVLPFEAVAHSTFKGQTYFFCAGWCKRKFDANPQQYVGPCPHC